MEKHFHLRIKITERSITPAMRTKYGACVAMYNYTTTEVIAKFTYVQGFVDTVPQSSANTRNSGLSEKTPLGF